jgi:hypothetical protein
VEAQDGDVTVRAGGRGISAFVMESAGRRA